MSDGGAVHESRGRHSGLTSSQDEGPELLQGSHAGEARPHARLAYVETSAEPSEGDPPDLAMIT